MTVCYHFDDSHCITPEMKCLFCFQAITRPPYVMWSGAVDVLICGECCGLGAAGNRFDGLLRDVLEVRNPSTFGGQRKPASDKIVRFLNERIEISPNKTVSSLEVRSAWTAWCEQNSDPDYNPPDYDLFEQLAWMGFKTWRAGASGTHWRGFGIRRPAGLHVVSGSEVRKA